MPPESGPWFPPAWDGAWILCSQVLCNPALSDCCAGCPHSWGHPGSTAWVEPGLRLASGPAHGSWAGVWPSSHLPPILCSRCCLDSQSWNWLPSCPLVLASLGSLCVPSLHWPVGIFLGPWVLPRPRGGPAPTSHSGSLPPAPGCELPSPDPSSWSPALLQVS